MVKEFLDAAEKLAYKECNLTGMPVKEHIDLACEVGDKLAVTLNADRDVVKAGTLLMDVVIGKAFQEGNSEKHVEMSHERADQLINKYNLEESIKRNILACIDEHHGVKNFYSLESEICCNADCYRFASVKGWAYSFRGLRDMEFDKLIDLLSNKFLEKVTAISLDIVKDELTSEIKLIRDVISRLK